MNRLFAWFEGTYGRRWRSQFTRTDQIETHKAAWADMLGGLTEAQLRHGLDAIRDRTPEWPPNAVDFRRLCLGLPDRETTIRRVRELKPGSDPVAREILGRLTSWDKSHGSHDDLERAAREHYADAVAAVEGEQLALPGPEDAA